MKVNDVGAKLDSVKGHSCNRKTVIIVKYYTDNKGLPLGFSMKDLCDELSRLGVEYTVLCDKKNNFIAYVKGSERKGDSLKVSASTSARTPGEGKWKKKDDGTYEWIPKNKNSNPEDVGSWSKEGKYYYWKPGTSKNAIPGYPKGNTQCWDDILGLEDENSNGNTNGAIAKLNGYRKEKGLRPLPTKKPFKGFKFKGTPPNLNVDLKDYVYGKPIKLDIYSSDRAFNFYVAEEMYSKKDTPPKYTPTEVRKYMEDNELTWHESEDGRTLMKVPTVIHQNVPHNGGVNAVKRSGNDTAKSNGEVIWSNKNESQNEMNSRGRKSRK